MRLLFIRRPSWGAAFAAVAVLCPSQALCAAAPTTAAETVPPVPAAQSRVVVLIQPAKPDALDLGFLPNLRWQLSELELTLSERAAPAVLDLIDTVSEAQQVSRSSETFLVAWITRKQNQASVYLYDPKGPHLYAREVAVSESAAAASEELALILRSAIQARLDGGDVAMAEIALPKPVVVAPPPAPPVAPLPEKRVVTYAREPQGAVEVGAILTRPLREAHWQGGLGLRTWTRVRPVRFGLGYSVFPGLTASSEQSKFSVQRHPMEAFVGYGLRSGDLDVIVESAFSADPIRRETTFSQVPLSGQQPRWRWLWAVSGRLRFDTHLASALWFTAAAGAEFPLNPYSFEVAVAGKQQTIAQILPVRPTLELGLVLGWW
jgi:hypothetical protein